MTTPTTSRVSDAQREAFEKWVRGHFKYPNLDIDPRYPGFYADKMTAGAWEAWQAALASLGDVVAVSDIQKVIDRWDNGQYGPGQVVEALRNLSAILNRGGK